MSKFKLTKEKKIVFGITFYRIEALIDFGNVNKGEKGGWIEKENNLSQENNAWVYGNASVSGNAWVYGNARVSGNASVYGDAWVYGNAWVYGKFKLEFGKCFSRKRKDWDVSEIENEKEILLIKDYKPTEENKKIELTLDEVADKFGVDVENLKIKK